MKRIDVTTKISNELSLNLVSATALQDLSDAESQTIQGGWLLLPAVQGAREAARRHS
ncbi:hypothetical protein IFO70_23595 [Phormidium tenue FACHB-886]|nr:hypothetical protein [Phormidium tenue FACHB-886]